MMYLAMKQHFTTDDYDYVTYNGKTNATYDAYERRKDRFQFERLARKYQTVEEMKNFFIGNFIAGDVWIGDCFNENAEKNYIKYTKTKESMKYSFQEDLKKIKAACINLDESFLLTEESYHPKLFRLVLAGDVSYQTCLILNSLYRFMPSWNTKLKDDPVWTKRYRAMKKLRPFMVFDKDEYQNLIHETFAFSDTN